LKHMIPFIFNVERESFHKFIMEEFSSFCRSKNFGNQIHTIENKTLVLVTVDNKTQIPYICYNGCCFRFITSQARISIWKDCCDRYLMKRFSTEERTRFDEWLDKKVVDEYTLTLMSPLGT